MYAQSRYLVVQNLIEKAMKVKIYFSLLYNEAEMWDDEMAIIARLYKQVQHENKT